MYIAFHYIIILENITCISRVHRLSEVGKQQAFRLNTQFHGGVSIKSRQTEQQQPPQHQTSNTTDGKMTPFNKVFGLMTQLSQKSVS